MYQTLSPSRARARRQRQNLLLAIAVIVTFVAAAWFLILGFTAQADSVPDICHVETVNGVTRLVDPLSATENCLMMPVAGWTK